MDKTYDGNILHLVDDFIEHEEDEHDKYNIPRIPEGLTAEPGVYSRETIYDVYRTFEEYTTPITKDSMTKEQFFDSAENRKAYDDSRKLSGERITAKEFLCVLDDKVIADEEYINKTADIVERDDGSSFIQSLSINKENEALHDDRDSYLYLPNAEVIGAYAFAGNDQLTTIKLGNDNVTLKEHTFSGCINLDQIGLPMTVKEIPEGCFEGCENLWTLKLPDKLEKIGDFAFAGCDTLNFVHVPPQVKEIGEYAFADCDGLIDLGLSRNNSLEKIGAYACVNCEELTHIIIPDAVTEIGEGAFEGCTNLSDIRISPELLSKIDIDSVFKDTNLDLNEMHEIADAYEHDFNTEDLDVADEDNSTEDFEDL